jgi:hypothetical protein
LYLAFRIYFAQAWESLALQKLSFRLSSVSGPDFIPPLLKLLANIPSSAPWFTAEESYLKACCSRLLALSLREVKLSRRRPSLLAAAALSLWIEGAAQRAAYLDAVGRLLFPLAAGEGANSAGCVRRCARELKRLLLETMPSSSDIGGAVGMETSTPNKRRMGKTMRRKKETSFEEEEKENAGHDDSALAMSIADLSMSSLPKSSSSPSSSSSSSPKSGSGKSSLTSSPDSGTSVTSSTSRGFTSLRN